MVVSEPILMFDICFEGLLLIILIRNVDSGLHRPTLSSEIWIALKV